MGEDRIQLGPSTLYFAHSGEPLGTVTEIRSLDEDDEFERCIDSVEALNLAGEGFSFSVKMASDTYVRLAHLLLGIDKALAEMCPNRRVVHLAKHAKKKRTRKKNYKRMIRICEKKGA